MNYFIRRGEENFGPYSLAEVQEYAQAGRVIATDLAQSEGMSEWVPVTQILGNISIPATAIAAPATAPPVYATVPPYQLPPNLPWAVLLVILLFGSFIVGVLAILFVWAWSLVLGNWARSLGADNKAMVLVAMCPAGFIAGVIAIGFGTAGDSGGLMWFGGLMTVAGFVAYFFGIFKIRDAMEDYYNSRENIALTLSGVMTFFFSTIYLQYHVNRIARWKKTGVLS
jgi:hypothetical protein